MKIRIQIFTKEERVVGSWQACRSTGPIDRQPIWHIAVGLGSTGRSTEEKHRASCFLSVDRSVGRRKTESTLFSVGRPVGRLTDMHKRACPDTKLGRPGRSASLAWNSSGRPTRSTARPETGNSMGKKFRLGEILKIIFVENMAKYR